MSWNGTVHCGYCGTQGHNKTSCLERRKYIRENPESLSAQVYNREQERRDAMILARACSYCKQTKHNRRGCKVLKEDKDLIVKRQQIYRDEFLLAMTSAGFGIGSLVKVPRGSSNHRADDDRALESAWERGTVEIVVDIHWPNIDFTLKDTNTTNNWQARDRKIARTRIVGLFGYARGDESSRYDPKQNDCSLLTMAQLINILEPALSPNIASAHEELWTALLIGPVKTIPAPPAHVPLITSALNQDFNLMPHPRAADWEKRRTPLDDHRWSMVRKSEYEKARLEYHK
jgi:hypothetical protein